MSDPRAAHRRIYKQIHTMSCREGCSDCCGPVPLSKWEAKRLGVEGIMTPVKPGTLTCAFVGEDRKCTVYDKRPYICRVFGCAEHPMLTCPYGCGPATKLTAQELEVLSTMFEDAINEEA